VKRLLIALLLVSVSRVDAQQHPSVARGFQADRVFAFNGIDNTNVFNGNLTVTIPIGTAYPSNGALQYRLMATYNSKNWDQEVYTYENSEECTHSDHDAAECWYKYIKTVPSRRSNAGMGWIVSLGRLISKDDMTVWGGSAGTTPDYWVYESPDGADHAFSHPEGSIWHTQDGSFLRLVPVGSNYQVQFPDGAVHTFEPHDDSYRLAKNTGRFRQSSRRHLHRRD
jgi:hypothetical protein